MINRPAFWDYITTDNEGEMNGIREDIPKAIKKEYEEYLKELDQAKKKGLKL